MIARFFGQGVTVFLCFGREMLHVEILSADAESPCEADI